MTEQVEPTSAPSPVPGPELVFAVALPVGTPDDTFDEALDKELHAYGYHLERVKLSHILGALASEMGQEIDTTHEDARISGLMDVGDAVCASVGSEAAVVFHGIAEMRTRRVQFHSPDDLDVELANEEVPRRAWLINSLKRPAEITHLRSIYGDHLVVFGIQASDETRKHALAEKIRLHESVPTSAIEERVEQLMSRDLREEGPHGQNMLKTFPMADVFVDVSGDVRKQVQRVLDLLFRNPDYHEPTAPEYGMQLAYVSSTRSPELGLKVGAALMDSEGSLMGLGVNTHPTTTGSPQVDASALDIRDLLVDTLRHLSASHLQTEAVARLEDDATKFADELLSADLRSARIRDLTEFQPTVHAEMSALMSALKSGQTVGENCEMFVTAYPCHNCAKHLIELGIKVTYLEPYPKSRAGAMYGEQVDGSFHPFTGIAPRRYQQLFEVVEDRKNPDGSRKSWTAESKKLVQPQVDQLLDQRGIGAREVSTVRKLGASAEPEGED